MTTQMETKALLDLIGTALNRPVPDGALDVWAKLLEPIPIYWAKAGAMDLLAEAEFWPAPAAVIQRARRLADEEKARQAQERLLALERSRVQEQVPESAVRGPAFVSGVLAAIKKVNADEPDWAQRRKNADEVAGRLVKRLRELNGVAPERGGQECPRLGCMCTHTDGCDAGWIEVRVADYVQAAPCQQCNPRRHTILNSGDGRSAAMRNLRDVSDVKTRDGDW